MLIFSAQLWNYLSKFISALSVVVIIVGGVFWIYDLAFVRKAVVADAVVIDLVEREGNGSQTLYAAVYVFEDENGEEVTIHSNTASWPPVGEVGETIKVLYDPDDPTYSIEDHFFIKWGRSVIIGGIGVFYLLVFATVAYLTGRRLEKNRIAEENSA